MNNGNWVLLLLLMVVPIITYCVGYRIGFREGCRETTAIAVDAIREVKEAGLDAVHELSKFVAEDITP